MDSEFYRKRNLEIFNLRQDGLTYREIGQCYGISGNMVMIVCRRIEQGREEDDQIKKNFDRAMALNGKSELLQEKIEEVGFSERTKNVFKYQKIRTIEDIMKLSQGELLEFPNFGRKSLNEIIEFLYEVGLKIRK